MKCYVVLKENCGGWEGYDFIGVTTNKKLAKQLIAKTCIKEDLKNIDKCFLYNKHKEKALGAYSEYIIKEEEIIS